MCTLAAGGINFIRFLSHGDVNYQLCQRIGCALEISVLIIPLISCALANSREIRNWRDKSEILSRIQFIYEGGRTTFDYSNIALLICYLITTVSLLSEKNIMVHDNFLHVFPSTVPPPSQFPLPPLPNGLLALFL